MNEAWRKSSYSQNGSCVELRWRKSGFSNPETCVELAETDDAILVRNSNHPDAGTLTLGAAEMAALVAAAKAGALDDLT